ncbi:MAG: hypothetical protein ABSA48_03145 [Terracidiphilus sp.]|jgi:hypothetical protein
MNKLGMAMLMVAGALAMAAPAFAQGDNATGQGRAVVTILAKQPGGAPANVTQQNVSIKVNGKPSIVTSWVPLSGPNDSLELVILIDSAARTSLGTQLDDIRHFVNSLPPNAKAGIAYMMNGRAVFAGPLSADHAQVLSALHLPAGSFGTSASPYFCLSDLAQHWPSGNREARREVVMVTDGVDYYEMRFDPDDPYVQAAISDSVKARLVVYSIYWMNQGRVDLSVYQNNASQSLLLEVTDATGGKSYWQGMGNPVSFQPYFEDLSRRLANQYELDFTARLDSKPTVETMKLKVNAPAIQIAAPQQVFVDHAGAE